MSRFSGRRAVVTGASRGIGAAVADRLAAEGADVVLVARTLDSRDPAAGSLTEVANRLHHHGGIVGIVVADLADADDRARVLPEALETLGGPVDILVNAAAVAVADPVSGSPLSARRRAFEVGVHAPVDLAVAALPGMRATGQGWIVNVVGVAQGGVGEATAAAVGRLTAALAAEEPGPGAVRVNSVSSATGRTVTPAPVVEAIVALCACDPDVTGTTWTPDPPGSAALDQPLWISRSGSGVGISRSGGAPRRRAAQPRDGDR